MPTAAILGIVIACVVVAAVAAFVVRRGGRGGNALRTRFGPEYDRVLARHDGDTSAAHRELNDRVEQHAALHVRPLGAEDRERFETEWSGVQARFVDDPSGAVADAHALVGRVLTARGYPENDTRADALSVDHPRHVQHFRDAQAYNTAGGTDTGTDTGTGTGTDAVSGTEDARGALLRTRELFDEVAGTDTGESGAARADDGTPAGHDHRRVRNSGAPRHRHA